MTKGLREDDRVIVGGLQRARPGARVAPQEAQARSAESESAE